MASKLKAPFPAFGGKSRIAHLVWSRFGEVRNFIEPFCFSAAMLLLRPSEPQIETINDLNAYVANFWRAIQRDPEAVAYYADWPVNETDLHARHSWLVRSTEAAERLQDVRDNPDAYNAKIAGWWCWGACMWIGSGWCEQQIPHMSNVGQGVNSPSQQIPHMSNAGQGVNSPSQKIPHMGESRGIISRQFAESENPIWEGRGTALQTPRHIYALQGGHYQPSSSAVVASELHQKRPVFPDGCENGGRGVNGRPQLADQYARGRGTHGNDALTQCELRRLWLIDWFKRLSDRLRPVRVCCGHWDRVCDSDSTLTLLGLTGVFLDPPYRKRLASGKKNRASHIYANDKSQDVDKLVDEVQAWCLKWGDNKDIRIAVCGLEGEYPELDAAGWTKVAWKSQGGYGKRNKNNDNAARERIWFSRYCLTGSKSQQKDLFA